MKNKKRWMVLLAAGVLTVNGRIQFRIPSDFRPDDNLSYSLTLL